MIVVTNETRKRLQRESEERRKPPKITMLDWDDPKVREDFLRAVKKEMKDYQ